jgi:hypothetical protein
VPGFGVPMLSHMNHGWFCSLEERLKTFAIAATSLTKSFCLPLMEDLQLLIL